MTNAMLDGANGGAKGVEDARAAAFAKARAEVDVYYERADLSGDPDGGLAVNRGARCYNRAMELQSFDDYEERVAMFQAAEYLYRIGQEKGNLWGFVDAGYIYYYDRCEGRYYPDFREQPYSADAQKYCDTFDLDQHAYECFLQGAEAGEPQSCYKVGDLLKHGRGCVKDPEGAFRMYERAYVRGLKDNEVCWGGAALRLGDCCERGFGTEQDFARALEWYERAEVGLGIAVEAGDWFFERSLAGAQAGVKRCRQELDGGY